MIHPSRKSDPEFDEHIRVPNRNSRIKTIPKIYEGWNFNSDNYLFTTDTK